MFRKPVGGPRIVPFGSPRVPGDELRNGHPGFRVTQRFGDWDAFFKNRIHGAMDLGNFFCRDQVKAMMGGWAQRIADPNGALGVRVSHPNGWITEYWHLSRYAAAVPVQGRTVTEGQTIGYVGRTGLDLGGCHLHVRTINPDGIPVDPWPLIRTGN